MSQASLIYSKLYNNSTVGFGAPTQRISVRNSTDKASWGSRVKYYLFYLFYPTSPFNCFLSYHRTILLYDQRI